MKLCVFGASPDTANLGVSALFYSVLYAIFERDSEANVVVFDYGKGVRNDEIQLGGQNYQFTRLGANYSRRIYRRDSMHNMRISAVLGGLGNPALKAISDADAVLDISGGDSFSDIYGNKRFQSIIQTKKLTLRLGTPLVLLPQTYGPYRESKAEEEAKGIVSASSMAWARDCRSYEALKDLLVGQYDDRIHCEGVDVAFALPSARPGNLPRKVSPWLDPGRDFPVIGFNISGLIYSGDTNRRYDFGLCANYADLVLEVLSRFLAESNARILLVPHVLQRPGHSEADTAACYKVLERLAGDRRVVVLDHSYNPMEIKWVISKLDFFCGTRMHSTIASLSSCVPTAAIAYSNKTLGVFESCGQGQHVVDPRNLNAAGCVHGIWRAWEERAEIATSLKQQIPVVVSRATEQNNRIFCQIETMKETRRPK